MLQLAGVTAAYGTRMTWPDDYFQFQVSLAYRWYYLKNWEYLRFMQTGSANSIVLGLTLSRNTVDNPIFPRRGSSFMLQLQMTPPGLRSAKATTGRLSPRKPPSMMWQLKRNSISG